MGAQLLNAFRRRVDRATDARSGRGRGGPQRGEQVVQEQHGLAGGDADDIAAGVDPPAFAKTDKHDVFLFGVDEHVANVLQAGQEDDLFGQRPCRTSATLRWLLPVRGARPCGAKRRH